MSKTKILKELDSYFKEKGKVLSYGEYKEQEDAPVRVHIIKRVIGPWARLERLLGGVEVLTTVNVEAEIKVPEVPAVEEAPVAEEAPKTPKKK